MALRTDRIIPLVQLLIPFAAPLSEAGRQAALSLQLPHLRALMALADVQLSPPGSELSLSPPHERLLAQALGWQGDDGCLPWAARQARADGIPSDAGAWGLLTPSHWHLGTDQVSLGYPQQLDLDAAGSRELLAAVQDLFTSEGMAVCWGAPLRWYLQHPSLDGLACASLDRVVGRNIDAWLTTAPAMRRMRRLQNEVQMLLYTHPANARREALGLLPVNSFWLSGCGPAQPDGATPPQVDERLRVPALAEDWAAWVKAWDSLDAGPLAQALKAVQGGQRLQLMLCGERQAVTLSVARRGLGRRLRSFFSRPQPGELWETL